MSFMSFPSLASPVPRGGPHPARVPAGLGSGRRMTVRLGGMVAGVVLAMTAIGVLPTVAAAQFATGLTPPPRPAAEKAKS
jgi:hypothetical protein